MKTSKQLELVSIFEQSERELWRGMNRYAKRYAAQYRAFGERMATGATFSHYEIRRRLAFAILSANAPWQESVDALRYVERVDFDVKDLARFAAYRMIPAKADYIRELPQGESIRGLLRDSGEAWEDYRERLVRNVKGLGRCKASFACLLLYTTESPLACLDTWMLKVYCKESSFKTLSRGAYEEIERKVQRFGAKHGLNGALAQWCIWDSARGKGPNAHDIFPGSHKDEELIPF